MRLGIRVECGRFGMSDFAKPRQPTGASEWSDCDFRGPSGEEPTPAAEATWLIKRGRLIGKIIKETALEGANTFTRERQSQFQSQKKTSPASLQYPT